MSRQVNAASHGPLVIAVDVGTGSAKAVAVNSEGAVVGEARRPYLSSSPRTGWAEQNPQDWVDGAVGALAEVVARLNHADGVLGVALTGQTPTVVPVDSDGLPMGPGLLYRDNRAVREAAEVRDLLGAEEMHRRTGQLPEPFHIAPKLLWLRRHEQALFARAAHFLQPRDLVLHRLTGVLATDETHANSTLVYDLTARAWAPDLLHALDLDPEAFPEVLGSGSMVGPVRHGLAERLGLPIGCPVVIGGADSQCAAYGSGVTDPGPVSEMAGTSSCINSAILSPVADTRISQYAHVVPDRLTTELGINTTGGALHWAVSKLGFSDYATFAEAADEVHRSFRSSRSIDPRAAAPIFLPFLGDGDRGDPTLRAGFLGLSDRHGRAELAYGVLEGIAFSVTGTLDSLRQAGLPAEELRVSGGAATLDLLGRIKADAMGVTVRHMEGDAAMIGAAFLGASATDATDGFVRDTTTGMGHNTTFEPDAKGSGALSERYAWFRSVLGASAIRAMPDRMGP